MKYWLQYVIYRLLAFCRIKENFSVASIETRELFKKCVAYLKGYTILSDY